MEAKAARGDARPRLDGLAGAAAFLRALIRSVEEHDEDEADQPA